MKSSASPALETHQVVRIFRRVAVFLLFLILDSSGANLTIVEHQESNKNTTSLLQKKSCRSLLESKGWNQRVLRLWNRRRRQPILAYRMMAVSILSYWEFGKRPLPENVTGFSLSVDRPALIKGAQHYQLHHVVRWVSNILEQATLMSHVKTFTTRRFSNSTTTVTSNDYTFNNPKRITFHYYFFDWHEKGVAGVRFHDTDVLISTMDDGSLVIAFAGTASVP